MHFIEITSDAIPQLAPLFVEAFNAPPWSESWTIDVASKRLQQMLSSDVAFGLMALQQGVLYGMVLGHEEQFFNGIVFTVKEFCVNNQLRGQGIGTKLFTAFEERLKLKGITEISLVTCHGGQTEGFYTKQGLQVDSEMVVMSKKI